MRMDNFLEIVRLGWLVHSHRPAVEGLGVSTPLSPSILASSYSSPSPMGWYGARESRRSKIRLNQPSGVGSFMSPLAAKRRRRLERESDETREARSDSFSSASWRASAMKV